jgi:hypothetical protein
MLEKYRRTVEPGIRVNLDNWRQAVDDALRTYGSVVIESDSRQPIAAAIREMTVEPTDTGLLLLHPVVVGVDDHGDSVRATLVVGESSGI